MDQGEGTGSKGFSRRRVEVSGWDTWTRAPGGREWEALGAGDQMVDQGKGPGPRGQGWGTLGWIRGRGQGAQPEEDSCGMARFRPRLGSNPDRPLDSATLCPLSYFPPFSVDRYFTEESKKSERKVIDELKRQWKESQAAKGE